MKKVLITGGAGFIGSHLCERLIKENNIVYCVDNLFSGDKENIKTLLDNEKFFFIQKDIIYPLDFEVDQIYNLACPASPPFYQLKPIDTMKTSIIGAINMLELASKNGSRILQASTSEIYGDPLMHPQKESYFGNVNPIGPRSCYDEGKRSAETLFFDYHREKLVDIRVVRIFNTYGEKMQINDGRVISNFIVQALKNEDITIYGDGSQTRSFCYISDLINGLIMMMNNDNIIGPINIGNPEEISILSLAKYIIQKTNSKSNIVFLPMPENDPIKRKPDISLAKTKLKWEPIVSRSDGFIKVINYFNDKIMN
tara:strand:- start:4344 stop:5279 length:936 start_codon:yes stop_codon:yes gene_type:complete